MNIMEAGWTLMGLGLTGVFGSLIVFYLFMRLLLRISRRKNKSGS